MSYADAELVKLINEELDSSIKEYKERIEIIDGEIDQWQSRLERLYDFVETRAIEPVRMTKRITWGEIERLLSSPEVV